MRTITYADALREAIRDELQRDERVCILGAGMAGPGGAGAVTGDLAAEFGERRVRAMPRAEAAVVGTAIGAALAGLRPIAELTSMATGLQAGDPIVNSAAKFRSMFGGQPRLPLVVRLPVGGGAQRGAQHAQTLESWYAHVPGLKVVMPATPCDARGMLKAAVRDDDPVLFVEHELLYGVKGEVPDEGVDETVPLDRGVVRRAGRDVTLVTFSRMVHICLRAAEELAREGVEAEVIDLRAIRPLDLDLVLESVRRTNRVVVAEEGWKHFGTGQGVAALIYEHGFDWLDAPIQHVAGADVPMPYAASLERAALPTHAAVMTAARAIARRARVR